MSQGKNVLFVVCISLSSSINLIEMGLLPIQIAVRLSLQGFELNFPPSHLPVKKRSVLYPAFSDFLLWTLP